MDIAKARGHLKRHPNDWQTKVAIMKEQGRMLERKRRQMAMARFKRVMEINKEMENEERTCK